jgi:RNA polymerase sigma factor (sigma-70 family)
VRQDGVADRGLDPFEQTMPLRDRRVASGVDGHRARSRGPAIVGLTKPAVRHARTNPSFPAETLVFTPTRGLPVMGYEGGNEGEYPRGASPSARLRARSARPVRAGETFGTTEPKGGAMRATIAVLAAVALLGSASPAPAARGHIGGHSERLAARARKGDRVARTRLVEEHMGLVRSVAFRYRDLGLPVEDLVQEGAIGLMSAIDEYDSTRGASFSTYAFWRVRAAVTHELTAHGHLIRLPRPVLERRREVACARSRLAAAGREPTVAQLVERTELSPRDVAEALAPATVASLDQEAGDGSPLGELITADAAGWPEAHAVGHERTRAVRAALQRLRGRKRTIVSRHFGLDGEPETLTAIAEDLHLSPERTRALKDEALRELAGEIAPTVAA